VLSFSVFFPPHFFLAYSLNSPADTEECRVRDYSPRVFERMRRIWGVSIDNYLASWAVPAMPATPSASSRNTNSSSSSSTKPQTVLYSMDRRYLVRVLSAAEATLLQSFLPEYYKVPYLPVYHPPQLPHLPRTGSHAWCAVHVRQPELACRPHLWHAPCAVREQ
jgi:hypothetical protein